MTGLSPLPLAVVIVKLLLGNLNITLRNLYIRIPDAVARFRFRIDTELNLRSFCQPRMPEYSAGAASDGKNGNRRGYVSYPILLF